MQAVYRNLGRQMSGRGQLESAFRRDSQVWIPTLQLLLQKRLDHAPRSLAVKVGPKRVVCAAQEGRIGPGARHLAHTLTTEWKRQPDVVRHGPGPLLQLAVLADV